MKKALSFFLSMLLMLGTLVGAFPAIEVHAASEGSVKWLSATPDEAYISDEIQVSGTVDSGDDYLRAIQINVKTDKSGNHGYVVDRVDFDFSDKETSYKLKNMDSIDVGASYKCTGCNKTETLSVGTHYIDVHVGLYNSNGQNSEGLTKTIAFEVIEEDDVEISILDIDADVSGSEVDFTVEASSSAKYGIVLYADGYLLDMIDWDKTVKSSYIKYEGTHSFSQSGKRKITVYALDEDGDRITSTAETVTITIKEQEKIGTPTITTSNNQTVTVGDSFKIAWKKPSSPSGVSFKYNVYVWDGENNTVVTSSPTTSTSYTVKSNNLPSAGSYVISVIAMASGYDQSAEAAITLNVEKAKLSPKLTSLSKTVSGSTVKFTVKGNADAVNGIILYADEYQLPNIAWEKKISGSTVTYTGSHVFNQSGARNIVVYALDENGNEVESSMKSTTITIKEMEKISAPTITTSSNQTITIGDSFKIAWKKPSSPSGVTFKYNVYVWDGATNVCVKEATTSTSYTIKAANFSKAGNYIITVIAMASNYMQSDEAKIQLTVKSDTPEVCQHPTSSQKMVGGSVIFVKAETTETTHTYYIEYDMTCGDCGTDLGKQKDPSVTEAHSYNSKGVCACGAKKTAVPQTGLPFTDVTTSTPYFDAIVYCYENKLFRGTSDTTFDPYSSMTRATVVTVLANMTGIDINNYKKSSFLDIKVSAWYAPYVEWGYRNKYANGIGGGKFDPERDVTIQEAVQFIYNYAKPSNSGTGSISRFSDYDKVDSWAQTAMKWAIGNGIYAGSNGKLNPQKKASRNLMAELLYNYLDNNHQVEKEYICFLQTDPQWSNVSFGYSNTTCDGQKHRAYVGLTQTFECESDKHSASCQETVWYGSGCGLLAIKNAVYSLNGNNVDIEELAQKAVEKGEGWRTVGATHHSIVENFCNEYANIYDVQFVSTEYSINTTVKNHMLNGGTAVINIPGHFMCIGAYDSQKDMYLVLDSAPTNSRKTLVENGKRWCTIAELTKDYKIQAIHLIKKNTVDFSLKINDPYYYENVLDYEKLLVSEKYNYYKVEIIDNETNQTVIFGSNSQLSVSLKNNNGMTIDKYGTLCVTPTNLEDNVLQLIYSGVVIDSIYIICCTDTTRYSTIDAICDSSVWKKGEIYPHNALAVKQKSLTLSNANDTWVFNLDAYNKSFACSGIASYYSDGTMHEFYLIDAFWEDFSLAEDLLKCYLSVTDIPKLITGNMDSRDSDFFYHDFKKSSVSISIPEGGYVKILCSNESVPVLVGNIAELIIGAIETSDDLKSLVSNLKLSDNLRNCINKSKFCNKLSTVLFNYDMLDEIRNIIIKDETSNAAAQIVSIIFGNENAMKEILLGIAECMLTVPENIIYDFVNKVFDLHIKGDKKFILINGIITAGDFVNLAGIVKFTATEIVKNHDYTSHGLLLFAPNKK